MSVRSASTARISVNAGASAQDHRIFGSGSAKRQITAPRLKSPILSWRRLVKGEVVPLIGKMALWSLVGLAVGLRSLVTIAIANMCINAAYGLCAMATSRPTRLRLGAAPEVVKVTLRRAWTVEAGSMLAGLLTLALIGTFYAAVGHSEVASLLLLMGWGLPARCDGPVTARSAVRRLPRLLRGWSGAVLVGLVLLVDASVTNVALALAAREWVTLLGIALARAKAPDARLRENPRHDPPAWTEFIAATAAVSMRRFFYQTGRSVLNVTLGPFGTVLARAGRWFGLARRAVSFSHARGVAALIAVVGLAIMIAAACLVPGTGGLVLSVLMLRLGCLGVNVTLWSWLAPPAALSDAGSTDDDDD